MININCLFYKLSDNPPLPRKAKKDLLFKIKWILFIKKYAYNYTFLMHDICFRYICLDTIMRLIARHMSGV